MNTESFEVPYPVMNLPSSSTVIKQAIETFVRGYCFTRSFIHPYLSEQVDGLWVMRDAPRRNGQYRREEWVAYGVPAQEIDETARRHQRSNYVVCAICPEGEDQNELRNDFKTLGYRLLGSEPLMVHSLAEFPRFAAPVQIERVLNKEVAARLAKAARSKQILPKHLADDAPLRQYVAFHEDQLVGWVRSIDTGSGSWCSNMFVEPEFRRRGIARALLSSMLEDDRKYGAERAVLLASHSGAKLYPVVGYEQIGTLLIYAPKKR